MASKWRDVANTTRARVSVVVVQLLSTAITTRFLGPGGRGSLVATVAWMTTFATLGYLSMA